MRPGPALRRVLRVKKSAEFKKHRTESVLKAEVWGHAQVQVSVLEEMYFVLHLALTIRHLRLAT
jgi:hypothetical protein